MPKVTEEHVAARKRQILLAAYACFVRNGFQKTTMQDICKEAQLSPGAVYSYFKSKTDLIEELAQQTSGGNRPPGELRGTLDELLGGLRALLVEGLRQPGATDRLRLDIRLQGEALHTPELMAVVLKSYEGLVGSIEELIRKGQAAGTMTLAADARALAQVILAMVQGIGTQKALQQDFAEERCFEAVKQLLLHGIGPATAPQS